MFFYQTVITKFSGKKYNTTRYLHNQTHGWEGKMFPKIRVWAFFAKVVDKHSIWTPRSWESTYLTDFHKGTCKIVDQHATHHLKQ